MNIYIIKQGCLLDFNASNLIYLYFVSVFRPFKRPARSARLVGDIHCEVAALAGEWQVEASAQVPEQVLPVFSHSFKSSMSSRPGLSMSLAKLLNASRIGR